MQDEMMTILETANDSTRIIFQGLKLPLATLPVDLRQVIWFGADLHLYVVLLNEIPDSQYKNSM